VVIDTALPTNWRERSLNETDPITMEDIGELDPGNVFLPALMCRLQDMTSGQFRDNTRDFFNNVMARYAVIESGIQN